MLSTFVRVGDDEDIVLTQKQLSNIAGGSVDPGGTTVEYRAAGRVARFWYTPGAVLAIVVAITAWLVTIATALVAYLNRTPSASQTQTQGTGKSTDWVLYLAAIVFGVTALAATAKLLKDVRDARK